MESEIKLTVPTNSAAQIKKLPVLRTHAVTKPRDQEHVDRYFDTDAHDLWQHGFALRVRSAGARHVQTLKGGGSVMAGLHQRTELEAEIGGETPDLALLGEQLRAVLPKLADNLHGWTIASEPVFVNRTKRTSWMLALPDGAEIECALDIGELRQGEHIAQVRELELEIKHGDPARLYELAQQVHAALPVRIENVSKAERGYALAGKAAGHTAVKAAPVTVRRKGSLGDALGEIVANCLQQMQANERGVSAGDVESLHQMRVGLRRLRAAQAMVRALVELPAALSADIEWLAAELGDARNWDVFIESVLPGLPLSDEQQPSMVRVQAAAREEAERHRSRVRAAIANPRYTTLMLGLAGWIAGRGWRHAADGASAAEAAGGAASGAASGAAINAADGSMKAGDPLAQKVAKAAPQLVQHAAARVRKRARDFDLTQPASLHKVRIAAKKERYAREFFAALDGGKAANKKGGKRHDLLSGMQDELGEINDSIVARTLVGQLRERVPQEAALLGFIEGVLAERALDAIPRARKHVKSRLREKAPD